MDGDKYDGEGYGKSEICSRCGELGTHDEHHLYATGHAEGKQQMAEEVLFRLQDRAEGTHERGCGCRPCVLIEAVLQAEGAGVPAQEVIRFALERLGAGAEGDELSGVR